MKINPFLLTSAIVFLLQSQTGVRAAPTSRWLRDTKNDDKESSKIKTEDQYKKQEDEPLFEGDIILTKSQEEANSRVSELGRYKKSVVLSSSTIKGSKDILYLWRNGTVPYMYASGLGARERENFTKAMAIIENNTCIRFVHKHDNHLDYIELDYDNECKSHVGRIGGLQRVTLSVTCSSVGNALHELGHAIGLWHEHSRPDRNNYIEFLSENLENPEDEIHFRLTTEALFKSVPDVGYDIQSVMHYSRFAYAGSQNGIDLATLRIREDCDLDELNCMNRLPMGQRKTLSYKDKLRIRELYGCTNVVEESLCIRPTPTPTIAAPEETESPATQTPSPSTTIPPPPLKKRLKSGNVLTLNLIEVSNTDGTTAETDDARGVECEPSPGCVPIECLGSACQSVRSQFQIIKRDASKGTIRGGNTVLLRSVDDYSYWLDCSDPTFCKMSECAEDNADDPNNASYVSSCVKHRFKIYGKGRNEKVLNTNHSLQFKSIEQDDYLKCNYKRCGINVTCNTTSTCIITDIFRARKLAE